MRSTDEGGPQGGVKRRQREARWPQEYSANTGGPALQADTERAGGQWQQGNGGHGDPEG